MKKVLSLAMVFFLALSFLGCSFSDTSLFYSSEGNVDGFLIATNTFANCAFVSQYDCTNYVDNRIITVPDEYDGIPITRLGGYSGRGLPGPFHISVANLYMNAPEGSKFDAVYLGNLDDHEFAEEYRIEYLSFRLMIGKNIEEIVYVDMDVYYPHINDDGSITFYHPVVYIVCSEENEHFYSKDGMLYDKETNELITEFEYATQ